MQATMMQLPLTVGLLMEHGRDVFPQSRIGTFDGSTVVYRSYADIAANAARLAHGLRTLGVLPGDRVATFSWNSAEHMECYLAVPAMGAVLHTVNIRLAPEQIAYVINHAADRVVIVDGLLLDTFRQVLPLLDGLEHIIVIGECPQDMAGVHCIGYEELLSAQPASYAWPDLDETAAAAVCYTSGTTGNPKGVVYSHRTTYLHSMASRATDTFGICERDRILLLPPMFHANSWGLPYSGWMSGSDIVMPGPHLQADGIIRMIRSERPTFTAMVPTLLSDLLRASQREPIDMSSFRMLVAGGSAVSPAMINAAKSAWGVPVLQGWGMTETSPLCCLSHPPREPGAGGETPWRAKSGRPVAGMKVRVVDDNGQPVPHDGQSVGQLQLRGAWVTREYHRDPASDSFTEDGWLRTGDVGHIDERHFVQLTDRSKDVIKSGGEWISSVDLENALSAHPKVIEVAVIATPDERWQERPLAIVVRADDSVTPVVLREFLDDKVARFWIPEYWVFTDQLAKTSVGKIDKRQLRAVSESGAFDVIYEK